MSFTGFLRSCTIREAEQELANVTNETMDVEMRVEKSRTAHKEPRVFVRDCIGFIDCPKLGDQGTLQEH